MMAIESVLGSRHDGNRMTEQGLDDYELEDISYRAKPQHNITLSLVCTNPLRSGKSKLIG